jgi:hypothetical protein
MLPEGSGACRGSVRCWLVVLLLAVLSGCGAVATGDFNNWMHSRAGGRLMTIWALSDIQAETPAQRNSFTRAVNDAALHLGTIDVGVIAGDLMRSRAQDEEFTWFLHTRAEVQVGQWYEILGNHDMRSLHKFRHYFPQAQNKAVAIGNILLLLLNDESTKSRTDISDKVFHWWYNQVRHNQDKIIITVSHAQLKGSGLVGSMIPSRVIADSERFEEVLRQYRVTLWLSGHTHLPQNLAGTMRFQPELGNTCFVNVSAIAEGVLQDSESRLILFSENSDVAWIRSRNHTRERFTEGLDVELQLGRKFVWKGDAARVVDQFSF